MIGLIGSPCIVTTVSARVYAFFFSSSNLNTRSSPLVNACPLNCIENSRAIISAFSGSGVWLQYEVSYG